MSPLPTNGDGGERSPRLSRPARLVVGAGAAVIVAVLLLQLGFTFLWNAPSNALSQRYSPQVHAWMYPFFEQNWQLFAPNPLSANQRVLVRVRTSGGQAPSDWFDLTAMDFAGIRHHPFPSHVSQNMLRRAWDGYQQTHDNAEQPLGERGRMFEVYLTNLAVDRLAGQVRGRIEAVQYEVLTTAIPAADWSADHGNQRGGTTTRLLPWWRVQ